MNELSNTPKKSFGGMQEGSNSSRNNFTSYDRQKFDDLNSCVEFYANKLKQVIASCNFISEKVVISIYLDELIRWKSEFSQTNPRKSFFRVERSYVRAKNICQKLEARYKLQAGDK